MAYTKGTRPNLFRILVLMLSWNMAHQLSITRGIRPPDLFRYLRRSMEKPESSLKYAVLRRRIKSPLRGDGYSKGYIGRDEATSRKSLDESPQLGLDDAYSQFLRNHLTVSDEKKLSPDYVITKPASTVYTVTMYCRNGYFVEVRPTGEVRGTRNVSSPHIRLKILMYDRQVVVIRTASKPYLYLTMTQKSKVKAIRERTIQSVFYYRAGSIGDRHDYFTFQRAYQRQNWFLGFRQKDQPWHATVKKGRNTNPNRKSAHFIVLNLKKRRKN